MFLLEAPGLLSIELSVLKKEEKSCARIFRSPSNGSSNFAGAELVMVIAGDGIALF